ncbi:alanine acetyltransferase [Agrilutibacter solisilvae]|uniref:Alanine acetyltransferase n=1 Tax=Agrilutibacter solisilvae TaxID=2763317 RepID=A0A974Y6I0_9GAMM|nr:alanine acetyltransferase [Lysobacter solisilvae]QSX79681.1 alanine acetyltransferase [Lysobacter solisilvae]
MTAAAAPMPWDAQQREWLQALGYDVLGLASSAAAAEPAPERDLAGPASQPRATREMPEARAAEASRSHHPVSAARVPADAALLRALARAAGRAPDDGELLRALPTLSSLRGSPAARRALWPRLRALRRGAPR